MKEVFDLFTISEVSNIAEGKFTDEQKKIFKQHNISQKEAIKFANEVLPYLLKEEESEQAQESEEVFEQENEEENDQNTDQAQAPTAQEEEIEENSLYADIEKVVSALDKKEEQHAQQAQAQKPAKTAAQIMAMLTDLSNLKTKHEKAISIYKNVCLAIQEHETTNTITLYIGGENFRDINFTLTETIAECLQIAKNNASKHIAKIEKEIEALMA